MDFRTTLEISQMIVNELAGSAFVHKMQGQLFKSQGFEKLGQKYIGHYTEEMEWVEKYTDRMLDLGCVPQVKVCNESTLVGPTVNLHPHPDTRGPHVPWVPCAGGTAFR